jgi:hypothetical protein
LIPFLHRQLHLIPFYDKGEIAKQRGPVGKSTLIHLIFNNQVYFLGMGQHKIIQKDLHDSIIIGALTMTYMTYLPRNNIDKWQSFCFLQKGYTIAGNQYFGIIIFAVYFF